jgi:carboxypeptidase C (cathepsin A)
MQDEASEWIYYVLRGHIKMMHYSGDTDGVIPTYGTKRWIEGLRWPVMQPWSQWKLKDTVNGDQVAGFQQRYDGLDFVTIKGAGHMAPQWKRKEVASMIGAWIHDEDISLVDF